MHTLLHVHFKFRKCYASTLLKQYNENKNKTYKSKYNQNECSKCGHYEIRKLTYCNGSIHCTQLINEKYVSTALAT